MMSLGHVERLAWKSRMIADEYVVLTNKLIDGIGEIADELKQLYLLSGSCIESSHSALILIAQGCLWDSEAIIRSIADGTVKFLYMCLGNDEERKKKTKEYWEDLPKIATLKHIERMEETRSSVDITDEEFESFYANYRDQSERIRLEFSQDRRRRIEKRWSFAKMIKEISLQDGLVVMKSLLINQDYGSHFVHQDAYGLLLKFNQQNLHPEHRHAKELGHAARAISDILRFAEYRFYFTQMVISGKQIIPKPESHSRIEMEFEHIQEYYLDIDAKYGNQ